MSSSQPMHEGLALVPFPLDEAVGFATVFASLFSERLRRLATRAAVKDFVARAKVGQVSTLGDVALAADIIKDGLSGYGAACFEKKIFVGQCFFMFFDVFLVSHGGVW